MTRFHPSAALPATRFNQNQGTSAMQGSHLDVTPFPASCLAAVTVGTFAATESGIVKLAVIVIAAGAASCGGLG